jgi:hypothetical protein
VGNSRSEADEVRPFRVAPFGARVRKKGTKDSGPVIAYVIYADGPMEYLVRLRSGRLFVPFHMAVPISHSSHPTTSQEKGKRGRVRRGESEAAAIEAASDPVHPSYTSGEEL